MKRSFVIALLLSALLHLLALAAPGWDIGRLMDGDALPLEAHLLPASNKAPAQKQSVARKASPEPVAPTVERTDPVAPAAPPPETLAATEKPPVPEGGLEPAPNPTAQAVVDHDAVAPEIAPLLPRRGRILFSILRGEGGFAVGQSLHEWRHDNKHYTLSAISQTTGIAAIFKPAKATQSSSGGFLNGELKPDSFVFDRGDNDIATASFDWKAQQVMLGDGQVVPIADGAEDFLSMFYQLPLAAQRGEGFVMAVATGRKVERYAFEWLGEEELSLKPGRFHAWRVRVRAATGGKDTTEVWLGKEVAGLPVKIRNTDRKGDVFEQVAEEIDYEGK